MVTTSKSMHREVQMKQLIKSTCKQETLILTTGQSNHTTLQWCLQMFLRAMVSGNTDLLTYADNDKTCENSWLTMLSGNKNPGLCCIFQQGTVSSGLNQCLFALI